MRKPKAFILITFALVSFVAAFAFGAPAKAFAEDSGGTMLSSDALNRCIVRLHPQGQNCAVNVEDNGSGGSNKVWLYNIGDSSRLFLSKADGSQDSYTITFFNGSGNYTAVQKRFAINNDDLYLSAEKYSKGVKCEEFQFIQNDDGTYYVYCKKYGKYWGLDKSGYDNKNRIQLVGFGSAVKWEMEVVGNALASADIGSLKAQYDSFNFQSLNGTKVTSNRWMSLLPDEMSLSDLSIPGAHDSGTAKVSANHSAQCQQLDYSDMLNSGVRYFDLRLGGDTVIVHNSTTCYYGDEVMNLGHVQSHDRGVSLGEPWGNRYPAGKDRPRRRRCARRRHQGV